MSGRPGILITMTDCWVILGNECWCHFDAPKKEDLVDKSECDLPCSGDDKEKCGGANRMSVWTFFMKEQIESFASGGSFTPVYTYSKPERTGGQQVQGGFIPEVYPAYTVEVVAQATAAPVQPRSEVIKRTETDRPEFMTDRGCFTDDINNRELRARPKVDIPMNNMTIEACHIACISETWSSAGLQNGRSRQA